MLSFLLNIDLLRLYNIGEFLLMYSYLIKNRW